MVFYPLTPGGQILQRLGLSQRITITQKKELYGSQDQARLHRWLATANQNGPKCEKKNFRVLSHSVATITVQYECLLACLPACLPLLHVYSVK